MHKSKSIKRKNHSYTTDQKVNIIQTAEELMRLGVSKHQLAQDMKIPRSTLIQILKNRDQILNAVDDGVSPSRKRLRKGKLGDVEEELVELIQSIRERNVHVTGDLIKEKAKKLTKQRGITDFKASDGWLERFKKRQSIRLRGEARNVGIMERVNHTRPSNVIEFHDYLDVDEEIEKGKIRCHFPIISAMNEEQEERRVESETDDMDAEFEETHSESEEVENQTMKL